jgi:hypothetical protein
MSVATCFSCIQTHANCCQAKLANEILGSAVDGALPLVPKQGVSDATRCKAESVCRDALQVLTGPGLKVGKGTAANGK